MLGGTPRAATAGRSTALPARLLVATRNAGKLAELRALFAGLGVEVLDLDAAGVAPSPEEDAVENAETFEGNALAKARWYRQASGGLATVADDSGLEVIALANEPGVRSRRWSGVEGPQREVDAANNAKLLAALSREPDRRARFVCALAFVEDGRELVVRGETSGVIAAGPTGSAGFGYDPLFVSDDLGVSFAAAGREAKSRVSHRARALGALAQALGLPVPPPGPSGGSAGGELASR